MTIAKATKKKQDISAIILDSFKPYSFTTSMLADGMCAFYARCSWHHEVSVVHTCTLIIIIVLFKVKDTCMKV